jgi:D-alanine-D-alanine ligase-like ATP-grasp enzyme
MLPAILVFAARVRRALWRRRRGVRELRTERTLFYRRVWHEAAETLGAEIEHLGDEMYEIRLSGWRTKVQRNQTAVDDPMTLGVAGQKPLVHELLTKQDVPVPRWTRFSLSSLDKAAQFMAEVGGDFVVKPARDTGGGDGVTTHVRTRRQLLWAAAQAGVFGDDFCLEQQIAGDNYRLLFLDGVLLDAVQRRPPSVVGDGRSTIRALVHRANEVRLTWGSEAAQSLLSRDFDMRRTLALQGLTLRSVPAAGEVVCVKTVINDNAAPDNIAARDMLCEAIVDTAARAARAIGARLAGVDIITTRADRPLAETGGAVLEVNTTPGFYYHYHKQGGCCPVALHVLNFLREQPTPDSLSIESTGWKS